jgi:hypothetical protein
MEVRMAAGPEGVKVDRMMPPIRGRADGYVDARGSEQERCRTEQPELQFATQVRHAATSLF